MVRMVAAEGHPVAMIGGSCPMSASSEASRRHFP
jgi:hypothetical protein